MKTELSYEEINFILNCVYGMSIQEDEEDYSIAQKTIEKLETMKEECEE